MTNHTSRSFRTSRGKDVLFVEPTKPLGKTPSPGAALAQHIRGLANYARLLRRDLDGEVDGNLKDKPYIIFRSMLRGTADPGDPRCISPLALKVGSLLVEVIAHGRALAALEGTTEQYVSGLLTIANRLRGDVATEMLADVAPPEPVAREPEALKDDVVSRQLELPIPPGASVAVDAAKEIVRASQASLGPKSIDWTREPLDIAERRLRVRILRVLERRHRRAENVYWWQLALEELTESATVASDLHAEIERAASIAKAMREQAERQEAEAVMLEALSLGDDAA